MGVSWRSREVIFVIFLCSISSLFNISTADDETTNIYLNSLENCGHEKTFPVGPKNVYIIRPNVDPELRTHIFRECEVTFHSESENQHVCVIEEGDGAKILDNNVELKVYDGLGNKEDKLLGHLRPFPNRWPARDKCSKQPYVTFHLGEINKETIADIRKVQVAFKVVDISSRKRTLYLDGTYCDSHYDLLNSMITLINRPKSTVSSVKQECAMRFDKVDKDSNSSICIAFIPSPDLTCGNQWHFVVSSADFNLEEEFVVYSRHCSDPESKELHVQCFSREHKFVTVALLRQYPSESNSTFDQPGDFRIKVSDYKGTEESFLKEIKASVKESSPLVGQMELIIICVCAALVLIFITMLYCNRKKLPCSKYSAVERKETAVVL